MPLPTVTVAGTINAPDGTPLTNKTVTFKTTAEMVDAAGNVLVPIQTVTGTVVAGQLKAANGTSALSLYASDTGTTTVPYTIRESWSTREFTVNLLTTDVVGGHIVYSTLGPVSPAPTATSPYAELSDVEARDAATLAAAEAYTDAHSSTGAVSSVFGRTGPVTAQTGDYTKAQVGLGNVDNTSDANKPVSTAQAAADALALKAASNLSDVANAATARTNLGLGSAATHPSTDFDTAGAGAAAQTAAVATAAAYTDTETARAQAAEAAITAGLKFKAAAVVATANVASLSGLPTTDGVTLTDGQIILLTGQSSGSQNGLWAVHSGAWTRPSNFAAGSDSTATSVYVEAGTVNASSTWVVTGTTNNVVGTNVLTFQQASGLGEVTAGTALSKSGNTLNVVLGATGSTAAAGNDSRLSDARTPLGHHATHSTGGSDAIAPGDIGAAPASTTTIDLVDRTNNTTETVPAGTTTNCSTAAVTKTAPALDNPVATPPKRFSVKNLSAGNITVAYPDQAGAAQSLSVLPAETRTFRQKSVSGWGVESGAIAISTLDTRFAPLRTYDVKGYGAKGDVVILLDGAITSGSHTLTNATGAYTAADVGKMIAVAGAGVAGAPLITTISAQSSGTSVTLTAAASTTVTGKETQYGTDDTAAFSACVAAALLAVQGATVFVPAGIFFVDQQTVYTRARWQGQGHGISVMLRKPGSTTTSVLQTYQFATFTGTSTNAAPYQFKIKELTVDSNKSMCPSSTRGVEVFGFEFDIDDLHVHRAVTDGLWAEWHPVTNSFAFDPEIDFDESRLINSKTILCGSDGFHVTGVHDSMFVNLISAENGGSNFYCDASGSWVNCHAWGSPSQYGFQLVATDSLINPMAEGASIANIWATFNDQHVVGGRCFAPTPTTVGLKVGKNGVSCADFMCDGLGFEGFTASTGAAIDLTSTTPPVNMVLRGRVNMPSGTVISGSIPTDAQVDVKVGGGVSGGHILQVPGYTFGGSLPDWTPADAGLLGWNFDPAFTTTQRGINKQQPWVVRLKIATSGTVGHLNYGVKTAGSSLTTGQNWVGLFNAAGTQIGTSVDLTTTDFASAGPKSTALTATSAGSLAVTTGQIVYAMFLSGNASATTPTFMATGQTDTTPFQVNVGTSAAAGNLRNSQTAQTLQTTLPGSFVTTTCSPQPNMPWVGVSV